MWSGMSSSIYYRNIDESKERVSVQLNISCAAMPRYLGLKPHKL